MKTSLPGHSFSDRYSEFGRDHDRLRKQLVDSLPIAKWEAGQANAAPRRQRYIGILSGVRLRFAVRTALAAAAAFVILFGVTFLSEPDVNPQMALAEAMENARHVQSIHFRLTTPPNSVEMWSRHPDDFRDFRVEYNNGDITTGNSEKRCHYSKRSNSLAIRNAEGAMLERAILAELGGLFSSGYSLSGDLLNDSKLLKSEEITHKGEQCLKITAEMQGDSFEYILDGREPLIYEIKRYRRSGKLMYHMEVIDVNREMPESLFEIDPKGKKIINRRIAR